MNSFSAVVTWSETDASGSFHFTAPLRWAEDAEHALVRAAGFDPGAFPRRAVSSSYRKPLRAGDVYTVDIGVDRIGSTSITYSWRVVSGGAVHAEGSHTVVHLDGSGVPTPVPDALRAALASHLREPSA
ncbi:MULTISPECIES: acyl-CoA thioesterase [Actinokineospora]|nr:MULTISPECIES: thioesterase family protein [Actinokineospora]UVS81488.1 tol-pal system-associated acyl-CoA thioesterase [Actinokineospora sp. UTMC 2448]